MAGYVLQDNTVLVFDQLDKNASEAMNQVREKLVESVQEQMLYGYHTPHGPDGHTEIVDTGALFDSITADWEKQSQNLFVANVGVPAGTKPAQYASYVHNGTYKLESRPFITDGVLNAQDAIKTIFQANLPVGFGK